MITAGPLLAATRAAADVALTRLFVDLDVDASDVPVPTTADRPLARTG